MHSGEVALLPAGLPMHWQWSGQVQSLRIEHTTQQLLTRVRIGSRRAPTHSLPPQRLNQVLDWIDAHLGEPVSLIELAAIAGVETSWFAKLFYRSVGLPPYRYVLHRRINHAQHALREGLPPADVAIRCGFVDQARLTRHFRRIVGVPPAAWAANAR